MKDYIIIPVNGKNYQIKLNNELDKRMRSVLKEKYILDDKKRLKTNNLTVKEKYQANQILFSGLLKNIHTSNLTDNERANLNRLNEMINTKKDNVYTSDLISFEKYLTDATKILVKSNQSSGLPKKDGLTPQVGLKKINELDEIDKNNALKSNITTPINKEKELETSTSKKLESTSSNNVSINKATLNLNIETATIENKDTLADTKRDTPTYNNTLDNIVESSKTISSEYNYNNELKNNLEDFTTNTSYFNKENSIDVPKKGETYLNELNNPTSTINSIDTVNSIDTININSDNTTINNNSTLKNSYLNENTSTFSNNLNINIPQQEKITTDVNKHGFIEDIKTNNIINKNQNNDVGGSIKDNNSAIKTVNQPNIIPNIKVEEEINNPKIGVNVNKQGVNPSNSTFKYSTSYNSNLANPDEDIYIPRVINKFSDTKEDNSDEIKSNVNIRNSTTYKRLNNIPTKRNFLKPINIQSNEEQSIPLNNLRKNNYLNRLIEEELDNDISDDNSLVNPEEISDGNNTNNTNTNNSNSLPKISNLKKSNIKEESVAKDLSNVDNIKKAEQAKTIIALLSKYKILLVVLGAILVFFLLLVILLIILGGDIDSTTNSGTYSGKVGLSGYKYIKVENLCSTVKVYNPKNGSYTRELDFETEYIPGVVQAEVGLFKDSSEVLKLFSIAARSYAIKKLDSSCTIEGSARVQAFTFDNAKLTEITSYDHPIRQAADATNGLVFVKDGEIISTEYDAACYQGEEGDYYKVGYGKTLYGEQKIQKIPKSWANEHKGFLSYMTNAQKNNKLCYNNHGRGISQYGSYYLATVENYDFESLVSFYMNDAQIYSLYEGVSTNYTLATSSGTNDVLSSSLRELLNSKGSSVEEFNEYILSNVISSGFGTRDAAVAAAVSLVGGLYKNYNVRLPYTLCGQRSCKDMLNSSGQNVNKSAGTFYGVDPDWGTAIHNGNNSTYVYHYNFDNTTYRFPRYGPECAGFVAWVLHNAGFNTPSGGASTMAEFGEKKALNGTKVGSPGDLMWHKGHIMIIVGVDEGSSLYYVAHASGAANNTLINTIPFKNSRNYVIDMSSWYENNKLNITEQEFISNYRSGYVDGYTGNNEQVEITNTSKKVYFVGDSRTVGMCSAKNVCGGTRECNTGVCLAKVGAGYSWFQSNINSIKNTSMDKIVINMGVNDMPSKSDDALNSLAIKYYNEFLSLAQEYSNKTYYIVSVNPVGDNTTVTNSQIETFNTKMASLISSSGQSNLKYIDTYNNINFELSSDGLHYPASTNKKVYEYIMGKI